jgi:hypothetical protein
MDHPPSTEAAVTALRAFAAEYAREIDVGHAIGADQTCRCTAMTSSASARGSAASGDPFADGR